MGEENGTVASMRAQMSCDLAFTLPTEDLEGAAITD
jgi:hypothetical protein